VRHKSSSSTVISRICQPGSRARKRFLRLPAFRHCRTRRRTPSCSWGWCAGIGPSKRAITMSGIARTMRIAVKSAMATRRISSRRCDPWHGSSPRKAGIGPAPRTRKPHRRLTGFARPIGLLRSAGSRTNSIEQRPLSLPGRIRDLPQNGLPSLAPLQTPRSRLPSRLFSRPFHQLSCTNPFLTQPCPSPPRIDSSLGFSGKTHKLMFLSNVMNA